MEKLKEITKLIKEKNKIRNQNCREKCKRLNKKLEGSDLLYKWVI